MVNGLKKSNYCCGSPQLWKSYQGVTELKRLRTADLSPDDVSAIFIPTNHDEEVQKLQEQLPFIAADEHAVHVENCLETFHVK